MYRIAVDGETLDDEIWGIVIPTKDKFIKCISELNRVGSPSKILVSVVLDSCSNGIDKQIIEHIENNSSSDFNIIYTSAKNGSPYKSRKIGFANILEYCDRHSRICNHVFFMDADDHFTRRFDFNTIPNLNKNEILKFRWEFLTDKEYEIVYNSALSTRKSLEGTRTIWCENGNIPDYQDLLKVPIMTCTWFPVNLLSSIFMSIDDPGTISGEEIEFMTMVVIALNNGSYKITYSDDIIVTSFPADEKTEGKNETLKSYTERDRFLNTISHHINRIYEIQNDIDKEYSIKYKQYATYGYIKAIADLSTSYQKYSKDAMFSRIDFESDNKIGNELSVIYRHSFRILLSPDLGRVRR